MLRNIIFDWSGTLVDDLPAVLQASNYVFRKAAVPEMTLEEFRGEFCLPFKRFYDRYVPHLPLAELEEWFHAEFRRAQDTVVELPHAREFLAFCRDRHFRTFVLSSVHGDHYAVQSATTGFDAYIDRPYVAVRDKRSRIGELLAENGLDRRETLMVGDMEHDMETARHGGVWSCAVLTGYNGVQQLRACQPDLLVEHLGELRDTLHRVDFDLTGLARSSSSRDGRLPVVTVGALIFDPRDRALMVRTHKWSDLWGIPGGKVKYGEPSVEALRRELKEETDLDVSDVRFVLVQDCVDSTEFYRAAHFVLLNYTCRCGGDRAVRLNAEAREYRWVTLAEALEMPLNRPTRTLVQTVLARRQEFLGSAHAG